MKEIKEIDLERAVQINNGLSDTSADGAQLVFDKKYGIMFCAYMPGTQGSYGESRGRISLSYFPATQPTNIRFVTVVEEKDVYCQNAFGLGDGKVRILYEKNSRAEGDHLTCFKDFDFKTETFSAEKTVKVKLEDGSVTDLCTSVQFSYLEDHGFFNHRLISTEQVNVGCCTFSSASDAGLNGSSGEESDECFEENVVFGAITSGFAEPILYRSYDNLETLEFFAIYPNPANYEFDYKFLDGVIYGICRTESEIDCEQTSRSYDVGKTWTEPRPIIGSIPCRPRLIIYGGNVLYACNMFDMNTGNRPEIPQGRTHIRLHLGKNENPNENVVIADLHRKYGMVNMCIYDLMGDLYLAYSTSEAALEYQNGNPKVRGKDAIRYIKLGDLLPKFCEAR